MFLDDLLKLADNQAVTTDSASTNVVDTVAAGDSYAGAWLYTRIAVAYVSSELDGFIQFQLQTSDSESFTGANDVTLAQSVPIEEATLVAGYEPFVIRIPLKTKRYLRLYHIVTGDTMDTGNSDAFITKDIDRLITANESR